MSFRAVHRRKRERAVPDRAFFRQSEFVLKHDAMRARQQAAAPWGPMPPNAQIGTLNFGQSRCSRTKSVSAPTRPGACFLGHQTIDAGVDGRLSLVLGNHLAKDPRAVGTDRTNGSAEIRYQFTRDQNQARGGTSEFRAQPDWRKRALYHLQAELVSSRSEISSNWLFRDLGKAQAFTIPRAPPLPAVTRSSTPVECPGGKIPISNVPIAHTATLYRVKLPQYLPMGSLLYSALDHC